MHSCFRSSQKSHVIGSVTIACVCKCRMSVLACRLSFVFGSMTVVSVPDRVFGSGNICIHMGKLASDSSSRKRVSSQISQDEETHVPPLSFSEFQGITDQDEFRQRAAEFGILTRHGGVWRSKGDILDEYKRKLPELERVRGAATSVTLPSLSELQATFPIQKFRDRAAELGLAIRAGKTWRSKVDILAEYKVKLDELARSGGATSGPLAGCQALSLEASHAAAPSSSSSASSEVQQLTGRTHGLASGSPDVPVPSSSSLGDASKAQQSKGRTASCPSSSEPSRLVTLPSLSELQATFPIQQFRDRAAELGLAIRAGKTWRSKVDILAEYKVKLDELARSGGATSGPLAGCQALSLEASHAAAPSSSSSASSEVQQLTGRTHGLASGSPDVPVPSSSSLGDASKAQQSKGRTHGLASGSPDVALSGVLANGQKRLTWKFDEESPWPSVEELEAITPMLQFQQRALQLGLPCRCPSPSGSGMVDRSKEDIVADYRLKLAELRRSGAVDPSALPFASGPASSSSSSAPNQVLAVVAPAHSQSVAEQPDWPSLAELQAITPISKFRARAIELGLVVCIGSCKHRRKADILSDYQQKLADMSHPSVHAGPASSSSSTAASSSLSALVSTTSPAEAPGSTHDLVSAGSSSGPSSSSGSRGLLRLGVTVQAGPCQAPSDDATAAPCSITAATGGLHVRRLSKRDREVKKAYEQTRKGTSGSFLRDSVPGDRCAKQSSL